VQEIKAPGDIPGAVAVLLSYKPWAWLYFIGLCKIVPAAHHGAASALDVPKVGAAEYFNRDNSHRNCFIYYGG
jgi:hypothetical protein